jgi:hypothetical protein
MRREIYRSVALSILRDYLTNISLYTQKKCNYLLSKIYIKVRFANPWVRNNKNYLFIHIPKNAGTSFRVQNKINETNHIPFSRYCIFDKDKANSTPSFAIIRDPVTRLRSSFFYLKESIVYKSFNRSYDANKIANIETFEEFVLTLKKDKKFCRNVLNYGPFIPQCHWIKGVDGCKVLYIVKQDCMQHQIPLLAKLLNIDISLDIHINKTSLSPESKKDIPDFLAEIIRDIYSEDNFLYQNIDSKRPTQLKYFF